MNVSPLKPKILAKQLIHKITPALAKQYGITNSKHVSLGLVTCDMDDALYVALDEATKHADVEVVYAKSFYAGSNHASGPLSGEAIGVIASHDPAEIISGLRALELCLSESAWFYTVEPEKKINFFPHVVSSVGHYLSKIAEVPAGTSLAYLIACPMEAMMGLDAAMKASRVELAKFYGPPTETNFGGGLLSGTLTECEAAAQAFTETIVKISKSPVLTI
ncbi:MAG: ethanolamine utilization microcompartment protein EutL [Oligoflexia bacterium]|nr:ethanolamine utilization microcompartment protein EutL [Oligoflexia bacterium]